MKINASSEICLKLSCEPVTHTFRTQNNLNLNNEHELAFKNHMPAKRLILFSPTNSYLQNFI